MPVFDVELRQYVYYRCEVEASSARAARRKIRQQINEEGEPEDCAEFDNGDMTIFFVSERP